MVQVSPVGIINLKTMTFKQRFIVGKYCAVIGITAHHSYSVFERKNKVILK